MTGSIDFLGAVAYRIVGIGGDAIQGLQAHHQAVEVIVGEASGLLLGARFLNEIAH